jgi:hypothetical protein
MTRRDGSPPTAGGARVPAHRWLLVALVAGAVVAGHAIVIRRVWSHVGPWGVLVTGGVLALVAAKHVGLLAMLRRHRRRHR